MSSAPLHLDSVEAAVDRALATVGNRIVLSAPLGLGKPVQLIDAFYRRAEKDPAIDLTIMTALTLEKPRAHSALEARFLDPFVERVFGDYAEPLYMQAIRRRALPVNIHVHEFYFKPGAMIGIASAQASYISTNYTFATRDVFDRGANVLVQLVAAREIDGATQYSLSANTDVSLDLVQMLRGCGDSRPWMAIAQVHRDLPFMHHRAIVAPDMFDVIVRHPSYDTALFGVPNLAVAAADHAIGVLASALVRDGGTLQIGIGSLGDAIAYACILRHQHNADYRQVAGQLQLDPELVARIGGLETFAEGLYGCSEMFVNGFLHMIHAGVIRREVFDDVPIQRLLYSRSIGTTPDARMLQALRAAGAIGQVLGECDIAYLKRWGILREEAVLDGALLRLGERSMGLDLDDPATLDDICRFALGGHLRDGISMHGGFFLGPGDFYRALREMPESQLQRIGMDSVRRINRIDDPVLQPLQRRQARFINSGMMVTLAGAVVSDGLESGQVVSGVGGQYNFVAQAHELPDARSILCIRATRGAGEALRSNIVPHYGHITIARHLRDIVITEYGIADLRGRSDSEIIQALLEIADSRFQDELLAAARAAGKIDGEYAIPQRCRDNFPARIEVVMAAARSRGHFPDFPFGSDFTEEELVLGHCLKAIKAKQGRRLSMLIEVLASCFRKFDADANLPYLRRLGLEQPRTIEDRIVRRLLLGELSKLNPGARRGSG